MFHFIFFGAVTILLVTDPLNFFAEGAIWLIFSAVLVLSYLVGLALHYWFLFRLMRIDADENYFYITNYFKTVRYDLADVVAVRKVRFAHVLVLAESGMFGQEIRFVPSIQGRLKTFLSAHFPDFTVG